MSDDLQRRRIGIREIAEEAGLSKTAVSYALNGTGRLDPATRERVVEIAQRLGYRANPHARNLRRRSFGVIAMSTSLPSEMSQALMSMDYFMRVWQGAMSAALERGYMLLFTPFGADPSMLGNMPIDGGIVVDPVSGDRMVAHLEKAGLPVVLLGRDSQRAEQECWIVDSPHGELAGQIFAHFQAQGARRIGLIQASPRYAFSLAARETYLAWCAAHRQEPLIVEIEGPTTEGSGYEAARQLLESPNPPDAIHASLDRLAAGALLAADHLGISVPRDLLIAAGSDGITRAQRVPITALDLKPDLLGRTSVAMMIDRIELGIGPHITIIPGELVIRASTTRNKGRASGRPASTRKKDLA